MNAKDGSNGKIRDRRTLHLIELDWVVDDLRPAAKAALLRAASLFPIKRKWQWRETLGPPAIIGGWRDNDPG